MGATASITLTGPQKDLDLLVEYLTHKARRYQARGYPNVGWDFECVQPPAPAYISSDTYLTINVYSTTTSTVTFLVTAKILLPNGKLALQQWTLPAIGSITPKTYTFKLDEGFLLHLAIQYSATSGLLRGQVYMQAMLKQTAGTANDVYRVLLSGYVTSTVALGWPESPPESNLAGLGWLQTISIGNPAAGADLSYTFQTGQRAWVHAVTAILTTSSTAANRIPVWGLKDAAGNLLWQAGPTTAQTASKTAAYNLGEGLAQSIDAAGNAFISMPTDFWLQGAAKIFTTTANLQAADQWSGINILCDMYCEV